MSFDTVHVVMHAQPHNPLNEIRINGVVLKGVTAVRITGGVDQVPTVTVTMLADVTTDVIGVVEREKDSV